MNSNRKCFTCGRRMVVTFHRRLEVAHGADVYLWQPDPRGQQFISVRGVRQLGSWQKLAPRIYEEEKVDQRFRYRNARNEHRRWVGWR